MWTAPLSQPPFTAITVGALMSPCQWTLTSHVVHYNIIVHSPLLDNQFNLCSWQTQSQGGVRLGPAVPDLQLLFWFFCPTPSASTMGVQILNWQGLMNQSTWMDLWACITLAQLCRSAIEYVLSSVTHHIWRKLRLVNLTPSWDALGTIFIHQLSV